MVNGKGFQNFVKMVLEIGSNYGIVPVAELIPESRTISRNITGLAAELRQGVKTELAQVWDF